MGSQDSKETQVAESLSGGYSSYSSLYGFEPEFSGDYWSGVYGQGPIVPPWYIDSQKRGENLPYYLSTYQLKTIRDRHRRICAENEFAIAAIRNRIAYTVGSGFTYRALPRHKNANPKLVETTQRVMDIFAEANRLSQREAETVLRVDRDGEAFVRLFFDDYGLMKLRFVEPEHIKNNEGDADPARSFGIETDPRDIETIRGYWVVENPVQAPTPKFVPAREMVHIKLNLDSASKRGLPLLYPVEANLRRAERLLAAMSSTVVARSKIALIRRVTGANKTGAQRLKDEVEADQTRDSVTGGVTNIEQLRNGTVLTSSQNVEHEIPDIGTMQAGVDILKAELRAVAACVVQPEAMLTADASGASGMANLVAEAPGTRNFEVLQRFYQGVWGENRAPGHEALMWRQIAHAVKVGLLEPEVLTHVRIIADAPAIIPRDPDKAAAATKVYFDMGATSPQIVASQIGNNYEQVVQDRKDAGLPDLAQVNGAMPGELGSTVNSAAGAGGAPPDQESQTNDNGDYEFDASAFE